MNTHATPARNRALPPRSVRKGRRALLLAALASLAALGPGCEEKAAKRADGKLRVVTTIAQIADAARIIGGEHVVVEALMGPGVDPHLYKASAGDLNRLRNADLVLYNGRGLEGKMGDILVKLARTKAVRAVTEFIDEARLLEPPELEGHYDPHVWFDMDLWMIAVSTVHEALSELQPANNEAFRANTDQYLAEISKAHARTKERIATIPKQQRVLITSHDAFRYFGRAYDIEVRGLQGISTVSQAGVKDVQDLASFIVERKIKAIFVETSVRKNEIRAVQEAVKRKGMNVRIGGELFSDAMGDKPPTDTYLGMIEHNVSTLVEALR